MSTQTIGSSRIFINYRREDTAAYAGRLNDHLAARFGTERVFMDIDTIEPGVDFAEAIHKGVSSADLVVVLIGRQWLGVTTADGTRRLDDPQDYVRLEIEEALQGPARVIPVLVQGAQMPRPEDLPSGIAPLARRNALELSDAGWRSDVSRLIAMFERLEATQQQAPPPPVPAEPQGFTAPPLEPEARPSTAWWRRRWAVIGAALAVLVAGGGVGVAMLSGGKSGPAAPAPVAPQARFAADCHTLACAFSYTGTQKDKVTEYRWDFGDGTTSSKASPHHRYAQGGRYVATLTVAVAGGAHDTFTLPVSVRLPLAERTVVLHVADRGGRAVFTGHVRSPAKECRAGVPVQLERRSEGSFASLGSEGRLTTDGTGAFTASIRGLPKASYRAVVAKQAGREVVCGPSRSSPARYVPAPPSGGGAAGGTGSSGSSGGGGGGTNNCNGLPVKQCTGGGGGGGGGGLPIP